MVILILVKKCAGPPPSSGGNVTVKYVCKRNENWTCSSVNETYTPWIWSSVEVPTTQSGYSKDVDL